MNRRGFLGLSSAIVNLGPLDDNMYVGGYWAYRAEDKWAWPHTPYFANRAEDRWAPDVEMEWQCKYCGIVHPPDEYKCWDGVNGCGAPRVA